MRRLTFTGYLDSYVRYLAGDEKLTLSRLAALTKSEPRITEPLLLWAVRTERAERLSGQLEAQADLLRELGTLVSLQQEDRLESALESEDSRLRAEYFKVWRSYVARRDAPERDAALKLEARKRALALGAEKRVSRYRMAKDLGFNHGNLHAFLVKGDPSKVSLERALKLVDYLRAA